MIAVLAACAVSLWFRPVLFSQWYFVAYAVFVFVCEWIMRGSADSFRLFPLPARRSLRYGLYIFLYLSILTAPLSDANFIYFQF